MAVEVRTDETEVPWEQAPLRVFGIATWRTGFSWPACRVDDYFPFIDSIVPRSPENRMIPSVVEDERIRRWRPFRDRAEREYWQRRVGDAADLLSEEPLPLPKGRLRDPDATTIPWS